MTFVKGVTNMLSSVNWVAGYWNKNTGNSKSFLANENYVSNEEPITTNGAKTMTFRWTPKSSSSYLYVAFYGSDNKCISTETVTGGEGTFAIPDGTVDMCIMGQTNQILNGAAGVSSFVGVWQ